MSLLRQEGVDLMGTDPARYTFGLVIDQISNWGEYENAIISGVSDFAKAHDINLTCLVAGKLVSPYEWERSRNILLEFVDAKLIDGLIILPTSIGSYANYSTTYEMLTKFRDIPLVTISEAYENYHSVTIDNYSGMKDAVTHLITQHGCRRLAFIKGPSSSQESETRYQAYLDVLDEFGIPFDPALLLQGNYYHETGTAAVRDLVSGGIAFDAIVAANDNMALGAINELRNPLLQTPDHVPVIGFDDSELAGQLGITTVRQSFYDEAFNAASMLLRILSGEDVPKYLELTTQLVIRSSCGCVPAIVTNAQVPEIEEADAGLSRERLPWHLARAKMLEEIAQIDQRNPTESPNEDPSQVRAYQLALVDALMQELQGQTQTFLQAWAGYIYWAANHRRTTATIHDLLSCLRRYALQVLAAPASIAAAENLFQSARVQVSSAIEYMTASFYYNSSMHTATLDSFSEELFVTLSIGEQMNIASEVLPKHGINPCFISLYDNPDKPFETARVIMAYMDDGKLDTGETGKSYPTSELLPHLMLQRLYKQRHNILIQALHHGDSKLGYTIFGFEHHIHRSFEIIRHRLSIALKSALLMADTIRHSVELEHQVDERTKELQATNQQLTDEMHKREEAQQQLKDALQELALRNEDLRALSVRDELTGLYNRRGFMQQCEEITQAAQRDGTAFILMFADLDKLKSINDSYGHEEGDYAIQRVAEVLRRTLPEHATLARLAGDEFTAIIPMPAGQHDTEPLRTLVQGAIDRYNAQWDRPYLLSVSLGFSASSPADSLTLSDHLKQADDMMYEEKHRKRGY